MRTLTLTDEEAAVMVESFRDFDGREVQPPRWYDAASLLFAEIERRILTPEGTREILERVYDEIEGIARGEIDGTAAANLHNALTRILAAIPLIDEV